MSVANGRRKSLTIASIYCIVVYMNADCSLGEFEQITILAILRLGDEAYGVSIRREIVACARRNVSPGALYTTLDRLEKKGAVVSREGAPTPERGGRAKRFYAVTAAGKGQLVEAQRSFQRLLKGLGLLGESHG
jgi:PadR family transcriptional regulator, regulatory protein PadR